MNQFSLVIFGITSNLVKVKLLPAIENLFTKKLIPLDTQIIGISRQKFKHPKIIHIQGDINDLTVYQRIRERIKNKICIFYLATYPTLYPIIFENMKRSGLSGRLMIEKPFGENLITSRTLDNLLFNYFKESNIYRIDHYLGKESVQNILTFRFKNGLFEPLINNKYLDHIQITSAEDFGVGDRVGYYDDVGALKDVGQSHILQMLAFATADKDMARHQLIGLLKTNTKDIVFGQYAKYESSVKIDTFFALKTEINSPRFRGIPIFIRAGKKLASTVTEISMVFKSGNIITYRIQPHEGIVLDLKVKKPGIDDTEDALMQFCYKQIANILPNPYENLLLQVLDGDKSYFNSALEIEAQWKFVDPLIKSRKNIYSYPPGSWGPKEAEALIAGFGKKWLTPSPQLCNI